MPFFPETGPKVFCGVAAVGAQRCVSVDQLMMYEEEEEGSCEQTSYFLHKMETERGEFVRREKIWGEV